MNSLQTFQVYPKVPEPLYFLETLSSNLWWSWQHDAIDLFRRVDPHLWEKSGTNPITFATLVPQSRLEEMATDDSYLNHVSRVRNLFSKRVASTTDRLSQPFNEREVIAYFSMEFGIHVSLRIFAGGLGVLAGDHLKASSNMGLPLVGVGLLYRKGYFKQFLSPDGDQQEEYPDTDLYHLPISIATGRDGQKIRIEVQGPNGPVYAIVWKLRVGRITLLLLDTNISDNDVSNREITEHLYTGDGMIRLMQEVLLGIGGIKALKAMGLYPKVCHMNEGHSAFSSLERLSLTMEQYQVDLRTALEIIPRTTVFTTHTPVPAGHDEFSAEMVRPILRPFENRLGVGVDEILSWGQPANSHPDHHLSMFLLGIRMARYCNGVSKLHGEVARKMWRHIWPNRSEDEIPISHVTNGIHIPTWISSSLARLYERHLGPNWYLCSRKPENAKRIDNMFDEELWRTHEMNKARLVRICRKRMVAQYQRRNASNSQIKEVEKVLDPDALTIGFARRFATYKRATLFLHDPERMEAILTDKKYPVQLIFAGKAHPRDNEGKSFIRQIIDFSRRPNLMGKVIFIEDYDMHFAQYLYQGADVWLNTPRRPFEACGTSGMKAAANGVLNLSILDGWWAEGYDPDCGWAIGGEDSHGDENYHDAVEAMALYNLLENEVIPTFYKKKESDLPAKWVKMMRSSMKSVMSNFCSYRMVKEYTDNYYFSAAEHFNRLLKNDGSLAKSIAEQRDRMLDKWRTIRLEKPVQDLSGPYRVGDAFEVRCEVELGELLPEEVEVQLYYGQLKAVGKISESQWIPMSIKEDFGGGRFNYAATLPCDNSGRYGYTTRIIPKGDTWLKTTPSLITWA